MNYHIWLTLFMVLILCGSCLCFILLFRAKKQWSRFLRGALGIVLIVCAVITNSINVRLSTSMNSVAPLPTSQQIIFGNLKNYQDTGITSVQARNGVAQWHHSLGAGQADNAISDGVVYAVGCNLSVPENWQCISALQTHTGRRLWHTTLDTQAIPPSTSNSVPTIDGAPIVVDGMLLLHIDQDGANYLYVGSAY